MKWSLIVGGFFGFLSVALGAFAAHALKARLNEYSLGVFRTGVEYQFFHALALILVGILAEKYPQLTMTAISFTAGIVIFSGSLYALALSNIKVFGAITPIGGVLFLVGWGLFINSFLKNPLWRQKNGFSSETRKRSKKPGDVAPEPR